MKKIVERKHGSHQSVLRGNKYYMKKFEGGIPEKLTNFPSLHLSKKKRLNLRAI